MQRFLTGVNYWASNAGADMWRDWREDVVERDLDALAASGVEVLRVFPNWRDFQPVEPVMGGGNAVREYLLTGDRVPENPWYLETAMLERFSILCRLAEERSLRLVVGLITGWMSGRVYCPPALYGKRLFRDPLALLLQQLFIKGFVQRMKSERSIIAWDLGNECCCFDQAESREEAYNWASTLVNAIRAADPTRPVVSGLQVLEPEDVWDIRDHAGLVDILTTHPYPFWMEHGQLTGLDSFRTALFPTAQNEYCGGIGRKPCLVEEVGTMGPMNGDEKAAADFLRVNLWSAWAHGSPGLLWWCAFDQSHLTAPPYDWNMCERELGIMTVEREPKPMLREMSAFRDELEKLDIDLPKRAADGVCILSWGQRDRNGIAFMSFLLAKQAGLTLDFTYCEQELPESDLYILPSVHMEVMSKRSYDALKARVRNGATLFVSIRDGIFTEFEELTGLRVRTSRKAERSGCFVWEGTDLAYHSPHSFDLVPTRAEVLARDDRGEPIFTAAPYGAGRVYFLNFPMEEELLRDEKGTEQPYYRLYEAAGRQMLDTHEFKRTNPNVGVTFHRGEEDSFAVLINYTVGEQDTEVADISGIQPLFGDIQRIPPFSAAVVRLKKKEMER